MAVQELPRDERCAAKAREFVSRQLAPATGGDQLSNALLVVDELALDWGSAGGTTHVWAELAL